MDREILFRGKGFGKWHYGSLLYKKEESPVQETNAPYIETYIEYAGLNAPMVEVSPDTIGQYTGLKDKNGYKIFEGDIIKTPRGFIGEVVFGRAEEECTHRLFRRMVTDVFTTYGWVFKRADGFTIAIDDEILQGELIGNVTDNPELMK